MCDERKAKAMQEVLENAQKQAKEDKSKHMQKKRQNLEELKEQIPKTVEDEKKISPVKEFESPYKQLSEPVEEAIKESPKVEVDEMIQTSPSSLSRLKLITPSKFRNRTTSVAVQTEPLK